MREEGFIRPRLRGELSRGRPGASDVVPTIREALAAVDRRDLDMAVSPDVL